MAVRCINQSPGHLVDWKHFEHRSDFRLVVDLLHDFIAQLVGPKWLLNLFGEVHLGQASLVKQDDLLRDKLLFSL